MADPTGYDRDYSFSGFQANAPATPLPGQQVDIQLDKVSASITTIVDAIRDVRRPDGKLRNGIVTAESLSPDLTLGVRPPSKWQAGVEYKAGDTVFVDVGFYRALVDHVSTDFAANLAAGLWELFADMSQVVANAEIQPSQIVGSSDLGRALIAAANATDGRALLGAAAETRTIVAGEGLDGGGDLSEDIEISIADSGVTDDKVYTPASADDPDAVKATKISFLQAGNDAVYRTAQDKLRDVVSVKDFGAVGDGIANDRPAFSAAHNAAPAGTPILVPAGTYYFDSNLTTTGRRFTFEGGATVSGPGRLVGALVERTDPASGARSFGVGEREQYGSYYRFGRNGGGPIGLTIGGGDPADGVNGNVVFPDAYCGWTAIMPTRYLSSAELAVQPASSAGTCTTAVGGNTVTRVSGGPFLSEFVGRRIYIGRGTYRVASVDVGAQTLTVTTLNGSAVSFASAGPLTFVVVGVKGTGVCNTSGTSVTRVSGDPFVPMTNTEYMMRINGVDYVVNAVTDVNNIVLSSSAGDQTAVPYEFWTSVDDLSAAIRVQRHHGAGFEERISIGAYASGYFHIHAAGGAGREYPIYIGTGYDPNWAKRKQIALQTNGYLNLGGDTGSCSLEIEGRDGVASNFFRIGGAATGGGTPGLTVVGADTNISMSLSTKGTGIFRFFSESYGAQQFEIDQLSTSTSWLGARGDDYNQPRLYAAGPAADIDIKLFPKGAGRVWLGPWTGNADAAVNGYITVKDSNGNIRKLATIA